MAMGHGLAVVVQLLVDKGADVRAKTTGGHTALHVAVSNEHEVVVRLLVRKGGNVNKRTIPDGWTAFQLAALNG